MATCRSCRREELAGQEVSTTEEELDELRRENEFLRQQLGNADAECRVLRAIIDANARDRLAGQHTPRTTTVQIGSRERMAMLEHTVEVLDHLAQSIAQWDCYSNEDDCTCEVCRAEHALASIRAWRFGGSTETPSRHFLQGAMHYRTENGWNLRGTRIHRAWCKYMQGSYGADHTLGQILTDRRPGEPDGIRDWPTARDWYVATSVVQWLVTNCGSSILEQAGWRYQHFEEDSKVYNARRAAE